MEIDPEIRSGYPVRKFRLSDEPPDAAAIALPPAERVGLVWPLTIEAWSLRGDFDAESRLPRHIVRAFRREG